MKKLKLMTILGTRPEIIRLSAVIRTADKYFDHILVHTGQNYDPNLNDIFFKELQLPLIMRQGELWQWLEAEARKIFPMIITVHI